MWSILLFSTLTVLFCAYVDHLNYENKLNLEARARANAYMCHSSIMHLALCESMVNYLVSNFKHCVLQEAKLEALWPSAPENHRKFADLKDALCP